MAEFAFNAFVTLLVVIDPSGMAPVFAALTRGYPTKRKREPTIPRVLLDAAILLVFAFVGNTLLDALGIGLPAFRIAGGVLLFLVALDQIFVSPSGLHSSTVREQEEESYQRDVFVFRSPSLSSRTRRDHEHPPIHRRRWYCRAGATLPWPRSSSP